MRCNVFCGSPVPGVLELCFFRVFQEESSKFLIMISVKFKQIPPYLTDSVLYFTFDHNDEDDSVDIPENCFKQDIAVNSLDSLDQLLCTIRYWGVHYIPDIACEYLLSLEDDVEPILLKFDTDLRLREVVSILRKTDRSADKAYVAAQYGNPSVLAYLLRCSNKEAGSAFLTAAKYGHVICMQTVYKLAAEMIVHTLQDACDTSCEMGHVTGNQR